MIQSNWSKVQQNWVHCPDPLLDRGDWSFKGKATPRQFIPRVKHDPNQGLRLQVRLAEAALARREWDKRQADIAKEQERQRLTLEMESIRRRLSKLNHN
jgi:hypothetical protein